MTTLKERQAAVSAVIASDWFTGLSFTPGAALAVKCFLGAYAMKTQFSQGALVMARCVTTELGLNADDVEELVTQQMVKTGLVKI